MYFSQALITLFFVTQVEQSNLENDGFKDKPYDKLAPATTVQNFHFKIELNCTTTYN